MVHEDRLKSARALTERMRKRADLEGARGTRPLKFHRDAKSPLVLLDRNVNGVAYRDILQDFLVPFVRQHFGDHFRYQDDNATPRSRVVTDYLQQEDITKMDQPAQSPDCNPVEHLWDELGRPINNMNHPQNNCQAMFNPYSNQTNLPQPKKGSLMGAYMISA